VPDSPSHPERRHITRHLRFRESVTFTVGPADVVIGRIYDLSILGIGILTSRYLSPKTTIGIHLPAFDDMPLRYLSAEVRHATAQPDGMWLLGCKLLRPLTIDEIMGFG
jgi:hypothetical protein